MVNKCIIFDIDGTIFDTKPGIINALNYTLEQFGKERIAQDEEDKYIGPPVKKVLEDYQNFSEVDAIKGTALYRKVYVEKYVNNSTPYDKIKDVLEQFFRKKYIIGIATMKTGKQIDKLLDIFDYRKYFSVIETAREDGSWTKTQMLLEIKKKYNVFENELYMIGDTMGDFEAAKNAGFTFIAADYGYGDISHIQGLHINMPEELTCIIDCEV